MSGDLDYNQIISEVEDMSREEFEKFAQYQHRATASFVQANHEVAEEVRENTERLSEEGGNAFALGRLSHILNESEGPENYVVQVREYVENSESGEVIKTTVEKVFSGFFSEDETLEYRLE